MLGAFTRLGDALAAFARRFVPDPFVLALALTVFVLALGALLLATGTTSAASDDSMIWTLGQGWLSGFSSPGGLAFALQMCLVLVTGHALAMSPPVQRLIARLAELPDNAASATAIVALAACTSALIHWGLGAIVGALLAREIGRHAAAGSGSGRALRVHYPLLGAAAYSGMALWHGGLSGSAPLKVAEGDALAAGLSLSDMLLSPLNIAVTGSLLVLIPLVLFLLTPRDEARLTPPEALPPPRPPVATAASDGGGFLDALSRHRGVGAAVGLVGIVFVSALVATDRAKLDINTVNLVFLFGGLVLVGGLRDYVDSIADGARGAGAIILQFPLYFGILGVMKASGMVGWVSSALADVSSKTTFPLLDFFSAGLVNLAVPSGGGQWAVQREILLGTGESLGVDPVTAIMAFSYGDAWTNMLQPFWALPLLGIMGLRARDIIGYTTLVLLLMAVVVPAWLLALG